MTNEQLICCKPLPISFKECTIDKSTKHLYKLIVEYWFVHMITGKRYESIDFNPDINKHTVRKLSGKRNKH